MNRRRILVPLAAAVGLLLIASPALAETCYDNPDYEAKVQAGADLTRAGKHLDAFEAFEAASELCPNDPTVWYNMGRANQKLGRCDETLGFYATAQEKLTAGLVTDALLTQEKLDERYTEARQSCLARYEVVCADPDVQVTLGTEPAAACPASGELAPGMTVVRAERDGAAPWTETVSLAKGQTSTIEVPAMALAVGSLALRCNSALGQVSVASGADLQTVPCPSTLELAPGSYTVSVPGTDIVERVEIRASRDATVVLETPVAIAPGPDLPPTEADDGIGGWGMAGGALLTVGVGAIGGGVAMHFVAAGDVADIDERMPQLEAIQTQDDAESLNTAAVVLMGVGGALAATGIAFIIVEAVGGEAPASTTAVLPFVDDSGGGLSLRARF